MTFQTLTVKRAKRMARTLQDVLKEGRPKGYSGCLEAVSRMLGFDGFNALQAELPQSESDLPAAGGALAAASRDDLLAELERRGLLVTRSLDLEDVLADYPALDRNALPAIREELRQAFHFTETAEACANLEHSVLADVQAQTPIHIGPETDGPVGCALAQILDTEDAVTALLDADPNRRAVHVSLDAAGTLKVAITRRDRAGQTTIEMLTDADTRGQIGMREDLDGIRDALKLDTLGLAAIQGPDGVMLLLFEGRPQGLVQRALAVRPLQVDDDGELFAGMLDPAAARAALAAMPEDDRLFSIAGLLDDAPQSGPRPVRETSLRAPVCRRLAESVLSQSPEGRAVRVRAVLGEPYLDVLQPDGNGGHSWQTEDPHRHADGDRLVREVRRLAIALAMQAGSLAVVIARDLDRPYVLDDPEAPSRVWGIGAADEGAFDARIRPLLAGVPAAAATPAGVSLLDADAPGIEAAVTQAFDTFVNPAAAEVTPMGIDVLFGDPISGTVFDSFDFDELEGDARRFDRDFKALASTLGVAPRLAIGVREADIHAFRVYLLDDPRTPTRVWVIADPSRVSVDPATAWSRFKTFVAPLLKLDLQHLTAA